MLAHLQKRLDKQEMEAAREREKAALEREMLPHMSITSSSKEPRRGGSDENESYSSLAATRNRYRLHQGQHEASHIRISCREERSNESEPPEPTKTPCIEDLVEMVW